MEAIQHPNPLLREVSEPVKKIDNEVKEIASELVRHINQPGCVGFSAIQLGKKIRMFAAKRGNEDIVVVNPEVIKLSEQTYKVLEGCLSVEHSKIEYLVVRHKSIKITGTDLDGRRVTYKAWNLFGQILQHETDHLNGRLVIDHSGGRDKHV